jgi:SAM-dependent methyltransferase
VTIKDLVRPLPGVRRLSLLRQRIGFAGSANFWERNYAAGGTSGNGSYGVLADSKAEFLNKFVRERDVRSVIEFGCGDGNQLSLASYPRYIGLDISCAAIGLCKDRFASDPDKSFFLYDGDCFVDRAGLFTADMAISLDVIYHLVEDQIFETYMTHLFAAASRYVVVYTSNTTMAGTAPWVRHRKFSEWVDAHCPQWHLIVMEHGRNAEPGRADFFAYERTASESG